MTDGRPADRRAAVSDDARDQPHLRGRMPGRPGQPTICSARWVWREPAFRCAGVWRSSGCRSSRRCAKPADRSRTTRSSISTSTSSSTRATSSPPAARCIGRALRRRPAPRCCRSAARSAPRSSPRASRWSPRRSGSTITSKQNGITPVETDLGEYIIQLRHEPPSHIIAPAIHLMKEQVAETFRAEHRSLDPDRSLGRAAPDVRRGARGAAAAFPRRRCRHHRRQFSGRRDRFEHHRDQRGQRRSDADLAARSISS